QANHFVDSDDVCRASGYNRAEQHIIGIDKMVGLFINTIPFRVQAKAGQTFSELLQAVHKRTLQSQPYEHVPLYDIQAQSVLKQELIDHLLVIENYPLVEALQKKALSQQIGF
ncbi:condensation domain-containing protein, partial [Mesorhizobium sp. M00.F.Ca.ET.186.01.1.1]